MTERPTIGSSEYFLSLRFFTPEEAEEEYQRRAWGLGGETG